MIAYKPSYQTDLDSRKRYFAHFRVDSAPFSRYSIPSLLLKLVRFRLVFNTLGTWQYKCQQKLGIITTLDMRIVQPMASTTTSATQI